MLPERPDVEGAVWRRWELLVEDSPAWLCAPDSRLNLLGVASAESDSIFQVNHLIMLG
jgi:hypothetical protein